jgi:hypothetical protein
MRKVIAGTALLAALLGCGANLTGARIGGGDVVADSPAIQTSEASYTLSDMGPLWRLSIIATYKNTTERTVYARTAGDSRPVYYLQKLEGGAWRSALEPAITLITSPPTVLKTGEARTDTLVFFAGKPGTNNLPAFEVSSIPGTYRVVYLLFAKQRVENGVAVLSDSLAIEMRTSNAFQLR